ncbi:MAG: GNAT family N-acetyltransferase [Pyrinomonadaceae bacterium]|nr:GNAT family N-acetyltransferase [Pyrinomonadaceae bacterium]
MQITIRRAKIEDAETLAKLSWQTFWDAFHEHPKNAPEDMKIYMDEAFSVQKVSEELSDANAIFLLAEVENEIAGYAKVITNSREPEIVAENPIELHRLYSHQKFVGKGIGAALMNECLREAENKGCDAIWLGVWEHNPRAQAFYRKYDFREIGKHVFLLGNDPQIDLLMQKSLIKNDE